jgi:hypothetical protein
MKEGRLWKALSILELVVAATVIFLDLLVPTLVILMVIVVTFQLRAEGFSDLGFGKVASPSRMTLVILLLVLAWTIFHLGVSMPVLNRLTGTTQDLSAFDELQGDLGNLVLLPLVGWTMAAFGEEIVYRGYLQLRCRDVVGNGRSGIIMAVAISSLLFGIAHTEQGVVGVTMTTMDAVFFSAIKLGYGDNLWPAVLAHGFSNIIGLVTFFLVGPVHGRW